MGEGQDASISQYPRQLGEYQLLERLGSGGMGTVYKARHTKLGRVVAVKMLTRGRAYDLSAVARFEHEMHAVGRLDHCHIVRAHDAREIDGTPILVMEYLAGLDLGEIVRRVGVPALAGQIPSPSGRGAGSEGEARTSLPAKAGTPAPVPGISVPDAAELARQAAVGLQTIHEHGLVHRDIKPSNLMLTADGEVKILDLGLARLPGTVPIFAGPLQQGGKNGTVPFDEAIEEMTGTGQGMGTADYMAPEQAADSRAVDIRADIYSLGCTLYKLLAGRAPFSGPEYRTSLDKLNAQVHAAPPPVRRFAPSVPEGLAAIVARMLAKNPAGRFTTPAEAVEALTPYFAGADLPALLKRAESILPSTAGGGAGGEGGESRGEDGSGLPSRSDKKAGKPRNNLPSPAAKGAGSDGNSRGRRWKWLIAQLLLLALVGGLGYAAAVILRIHKDGKETTVKLDEGSEAAVKNNGDIDVTLPSAWSSGFSRRRWSPRFRRRESKTA